VTLEQTANGEDHRQSEQLATEDDTHHIDGRLPADLAVPDDDGAW
jgi:hypothetical protein